MKTTMHGAFTLAALVVAQSLVVGALAACNGSAPKPRHHVAGEGSVAEVPPRDAKSGSGGVTKPSTRFVPPGLADVRYSSPLFAKHVQVSAALNSTPLRPGDEFQIAVVFRMEVGWHIYGNPIGPGVGRATVLEATGFTDAVGVRVRYAASTKGTQNFGDAGKTWVWENRGRVVHYVVGRVRSDATPGPRQWQLHARAQACTESQCLPAKITIPISVQVSPKGTAQREQHKEDFAALGDSHSIGS